MKQFLENNRLLKEDEYLLKVYTESNPPKGFLTKLNQDGSIPVNFQKWTGRYSGEQLPYEIVKENFFEGWRIHEARYGESQNWAVLIHPEGFTVEIHMNKFIELLKTITCSDGVLEGKFKWAKNKLIPQ